ncbi:MAG: DUF2892 domain-containing protein [Gammaproteobacteria bacterium]|nr:DUF2892 domain-containing protein [Gammaproteobacteria bacterium]
MCNVNGIGQILRIVSGLILIALAWYGPQTSILSPEWWHLWKLGWIGIIPLLSGILAFCPFYAVFGSSRQQKKK